MLGELFPTAVNQDFMRVLLPRDPARAAPARQRPIGPPPPHRRRRFRGE